MSEYGKLQKAGLRRGRKPLDKDEKSNRAKTVRLKVEARRRAGIVLRHRYPTEFEQLVAEELKAML